MEKLKDYVKNIGKYIKGIFIPEQIIIQDGIVVSPPRSVAPYVVIAFVFVSYFAIQATEFSIFEVIYKLFGIDILNNHFEGPWRAMTGWEYLSRYFFPIDYGYWREVISPLVDTIQMSFLGSFIGSAIALPVAFLASSNINKNKFTLTSARAVLTIFRTIPMIIYAVIFVWVFGKNVLPGTMAIGLFTFSIVAKMLFEKIETIDLGSYEAIESTGASKGKSIVTAVLPQILPSFYSMSLYAFEINVRYAAILGYVGAGGIGLILQSNMADLDLTNRVFTMLFFIWIVVISIETISRFLRRRLA